MACPILKAFFLTLLLAWTCTDAEVLTPPLHIVAAENVYGDTAAQIGGPYVSVLSILNNPAQDPHLFNINPSTATAIANADILIYNGADYDAWVQPLLAIKSTKTRQVLVIAQLMHISPGNNPHLWYMPETMLVYVQHLTILLSEKDPLHRTYFENQFKMFAETYQTLVNTIQRLQRQYQGTPVIATEPLFAYMAKSLGLKMHGEGFQINIMNDVPPSISQIKQFEDDLRQHNVRVLIYNNQVINPLTQRMLVLAQQENIPVVGMSETLPTGMTYIQWMTKQLADLEKALQSSSQEKKK